MVNLLAMVIFCYVKEILWNFAQHNGQVYKLLFYHDINILDLFVCVWSVGVYPIDLSMICIFNLPQLGFKLTILI